MCRRYQHLTPADYPPPYEQTLWGLYDVPDYVRNLFNLPVVAYSGEVDKQKDAADFMAETFAAEGHELVHLIGPNMPHKYDPAVLAQVMERMHAAVERRRDPAMPNVSLQTRTLHYNRLHWVEALGLGQHWQDSRIDARYTSDDVLAVETRNIQSLRLRPPRAVARLSIDGQDVAGGAGPLEFAWDGTRWAAAASGEAAGLRKRPGLQGPIDDVLMAPFLVVLPSGKSTPAVERWVQFELDHFRRRWKNVYRGELRRSRDVDLTPRNIEQYHLIAWGDPQSNALLRRTVQALPIEWTAEQLNLGPHHLAASDHVPLLIYPNPLNPAKYLVLNSGPTHREAHDRTNSLQNPKLGDWALIDVTVAPDRVHPGGVVAAGFFDEEWQFPGQVSASPAPNSPGR